MIKEKPKKIIKKKTIFQTFMEYFKTIFFSFLFALVFTVCLSIQARNEMIKNYYASIDNQQKIDEQLAKQIIAQSDLTKNLVTKNYTVCMQVGNLYETAKDYPNAQIAYESAIEKAKAGTYTPYYKLVRVLFAQEKFDEAEKIINSKTDTKNINLIKFKTKSYIAMGDKYYSIGKFLSAAKAYERASYYYNRFSKKDNKIVDSIKMRIVNSYSEASTLLVKKGYNSDAAKYLKRAEKYAPENFHIKYKLAIIYADTDPIKSVEYFEPLLKKMPQYIDYSTYNRALLKAATISELEGNDTKAKYYRYKSHSIDLMIDKKVIYKNDVEVTLEDFKIKKLFFKYHLIGTYRFKNVSNTDIYKMHADFVLKQGDKIKETVTLNCVTKKKPLYSNGEETDKITAEFSKNIFTRRELNQYSIEIYVYKDEKFKTLIGTLKIPEKTNQLPSSDILPLSH